MAGSDHDYNIVVTLTSDASGDATETVKNVNGLIPGFYVDYAADVDAGCDLTIVEEAAGVDVPVASAENSNTDGWVLPTQFTNFPCGGHLKFTIAGAGDTKVVTIIGKVV